MNPNAMSVNELAAQASTSQLLAGIDRARRALTTGRDGIGWATMLAKLSEALRLQMAAHRAIQAPTTTYTPQHARARAEYLGTGADGLASYLTKGF